MLGVVAIGVDAQAVAETRFFGDQFLGDVLDIGQQPRVRRFELVQHLGQRHVARPLTSACVEGVDPAHRRVAWRAAAGADRKLISAVNVFDVFEGASLGDGKKSVAIEVVIQPTDKTLTDEDFEALTGKIVGNVVKTTGGALRA